MTAPWVLLRGLMRDGRHWGDFVDKLADAFPGSEVITLDAPGNGSRYLERSPISVEALADDCREQLRQRGLAPPYRVLAMSLGAMVAVSWAQRTPQELQCAVLINTSLRPFSRFWQRLRPGVYPTALRIALGQLDAHQREAAVLRFTSHHAAERQSMLKDWSRWQQQQPVSGANGLRQIAAAAGFVAPRQKPAVPMLILCGARDRLVHPSCSQRLAAAWQCDFAEHPEAGHDLPLDDAGWVASQVSDWEQRGFKKRK